jgi:uncharacterized protein
VYPWPNNATFDYQIEVEMFRFEQSVSGECQLTARWAIKDGRTQNDLIIRESQFTHPASAADTATAVAALSATLGDLSQEIATSLHGLPKVSNVAGSGKFSSDRTIADTRPTSGMRRPAP